MLSSRAGFWTALISLSLVAAIGTLDHRLGNELSLSIFYILPVAVGAWYAGPRIGLILSVISGMMCFLVDQTSGRHYVHFATPLWNASVRFSVFVLTMFLMVRLRKALERYETLAEQDGLTGILNARTFKQRYRWIAPFATRYGHPMALGYLDLDGFKGINDSLGHHVGDRVLKAVAGTIAQEIRSSDLFGRLGGDEFAILLPETDLLGAMTFFTEVRERLMQLANRNRWPLGFSIGVTVFHAHPADPEIAIQRADALMYKVKCSGKNRTLFEEVLDETKADQCL